MKDEKIDLEDMTIKQIFQSIGRLHYRKIIGIVTTMITVMSMSFAVGRYSYQRDTAVLLDNPFAMRIVIDGRKNDFESLTLVKDPSSPIKLAGKITLSIREIQSAFDIIQVGEVVANIEPSELKKVWASFYTALPISTNAAYAAQSKTFSWYGHEKDLHFSEKFIDQDTVNRTYSDGCILEYKVESLNKSIKRESIHSSFKWIKVNHKG